MDESVYRVGCFRTRRKSSGGVEAPSVFCWNTEATTNKYQYKKTR